MRFASLAVLAALAVPLVAADPASARTAKFSAPVTAEAGWRPLAIVTADFDRNGFPDLAIASAYEVSVDLGRGDGGFGERRAYFVDGDPRDIATGDVDGDGDADLVVPSIRPGGARGAISVLINDGRGSFRSGQISTLTTGTVATADFDGDGALDIMVLVGRKGAAVLLGSGDGRFARPLVSAVGDAENLAVGDVNLDGRPDAVLPRFVDDRVAVLLGNGDGTFGPGRRYKVGRWPTAATIADVNGDGKPDLATANWEGSNVSILLGRGDGSFAPGTQYAMTRSPENVVVADFDADGHVDLAVSNDDGPPAVASGHGDGTFDPPRRIPWDSAMDGVAADFDLDGRMDLAFAVTDRVFADVFLNWTGLPAPPCVVLGVTSWNLRKATKYIHDAGCLLGAVTRRYARDVRKGRVIKQSHASGEVLPSGAPIDLVVSLGRRR